MKITDLVDGHPGGGLARPDELGPGLEHVLVDQVLPLQDHVLTLPVLDHPQNLQCADDVVGVDAHLLAEKLDGELLVRAAVADVLQDDVLPVRPENYNSYS